MKKVQEYISNTPFFKNILKQYKELNELSIANSNDDLSVLLLQYLFQNNDESIVLVTPNLYKAQKLYDQLSTIINATDIAFFPQDEFITTEMLAMSSEFKLERINTIEKILTNKKTFVITNTTGFIKKITPLKTWEKAKISLEKGTVLDVDLFLQTLISYGYKRELAVENQGDISVRGGIIDIYPFNEIHPIRIEFFDDEVETIRYFDINTQRSTVQTKNITIYPLYEFIYSNDDFIQIETKVRQFIKSNQLDNKTRTRFDDELESLRNYNNVDQLTRYMTLLNTKTETISDYLGNKRVIYYDHESILGNYTDIVRDITDWYSSTEDYPKIGFDLISDINHIYNGKSLYLDVFGEKKRKTTHINIRSKEAVVYNNNLHMAIKDFSKYNNYTTIILGFHTEKQRKQFISLVEDKIEYKIIGPNDQIIQKKLNLVVEDTLFSFELFDVNTIVLTEDNLFKKKETKKAKYRSSIKEAKKIGSLDELKKGDYIVHYDHGIGRFIGVQTMTLGEHTNDYIHIAYKGDDSLYIPVENITLIQKFIGSEGSKPRLHKLGGSEWARTKQKVRKKVKDIADKLIALYAKRESTTGFAYSPDTELQEEFENEFEYQETPDQLSAIEDIKRDMQSPVPMDRLLCGDVGYGKTEVALRAAFKAVLDNKQVAYLAPTTVLSRQHFYTFRNRLDKHGIKVELLNRFVTPANQRRVMRDLRMGIVDVVIGTHRILSNDMEFADLGLLIIDEEQRFGVEHKEKIKEMKVNVDVLSLSATPIPRTLQMAIMGVKSMSLLETPPANRYPIQTYVLERNDQVIKDSIEREMARRGQVFYLYNRVDDINLVANHISRLVPEARVVYAHGKMNRLELEDVIENFLNKEYDVLVSTTIIETGIDIPNANTLLIHDSDRLGLSQLYQIRGRVGRSDRIAYAYLMYNKRKVLTEEAVKRLRVIKEFTELGSGFKIAVRDLSIRGAGDILGTEQSGFMDSVGLDLYLDMLKDEIAIQRGEKTEGEKTEQTNVKVQVSKFIDSSYIDNDYTKIEIHRKIAKIKSKQDIDLLKDELTDRFGKPSHQIVLYMYEKYFEYLASEKGVEKVRSTKNNMTFILSKEASTKVNGEFLFMKANEISKFIRFTYRLERLNIIIDTIKLQQHYLYYIVDILELL